MKFSPQVDIRSEFNFLDSLIKMEQYINFIKDNDFLFAFYSELDSMYGVPNFFNLAKKNNVKPIIGLTTEIAYDNQLLKIIFYPKTKVGYEKISELSSKIMCEEFLSAQDKAQWILDNIIDNFLIIEFEKKIIDTIVNNFFKTFNKENVFVGINDQNFNSKNNLDCNFIFQKQ